MEPIQSTAGAVPVLNEKGEVSMQKVKVHRYVSGKRPEYAPASSSEEESEEEDFLEVQKPKEPSPGPETIEIPPEKILASEDRRLKRLIQRKLQEEQEEEEERRNRRRVRETEASESESDDDRMDLSEEDDEDEDDEDLSDEEIERRRKMLRMRVLNQKVQQSEALEKEDEKALSSEDSGTESSEYEEYTDSEGEAEARLKPVFTLKKNRLTLIEKEKEAAKKKQEEIEAKKKAEERRRQTLKIVEEEIRKDQAAMKNNEEGSIEDVCTDDENDEVEYEAWKLRELKRNKRDKEEREQREREIMEIEKLRNMTEEERRQDIRNNPKTITNKSVKGKYKFMQKYYHRGAFYLDKDDGIYKRNFATATLDDHFDKTVLPKVMQVKNFGRSGRTKYTHLVDQDTTQFDSPWISETSQNHKFHENQAAGVKQVFSRPSLRKNKQK